MDSIGSALAHAGTGVLLSFGSSLATTLEACPPLDESLVVPSATIGCWGPVTWERRGALFTQG